MLRTRIISALIGIPLLVGAAYLGGIYWLGLNIVLAGFGLGEYMTMMRRKGGQPLVMGAYAVAGILMLRLYLGQYLEIWFLGALLLMVVTMLIRYPHSSFDDLALSFLGAVYCGFFFGFAVAWNESATPFPGLMLVFALAWASDIGGYLFGSLWGKHKLAPHLSPAKTWEGALGSVVMSVLTAMVFKYLTGIIAGSWIYFLGMGLVASLAAQVGDLLESSLKRYFGVKDSGMIIPGHGGVLDRFDSFMLVMPAVYYYLLLW